MFLLAAVFFLAFPARAKIVNQIGTGQGRLVIAISDDWQLTLRGRYTHEIEGSTHLVRTESFVCRITVVKAKKGASPKDRLHELERDLPSGVVESWEYPDSVPIRFAYILPADSGPGQSWIYRAFTIGKNSCVELTFSLKSRMADGEAASIWMAVTERTEPNQSSQRNAMARPISVFESRSSRG